jgi:hypothetical protein
MDMEFGDVLAGVGVGLRHPDDDGLVDEAAAGVAKRPDGGAPWRRKGCFT